jgi:transketolase
MNSLHTRILELARKHHLSHLGSALTSVDIIDSIYHDKREDEPFILSCGHCGLSLYVILEKYYGFDAERLLLKHGTHPHRSIEDKISVSTGSLGHGLPIALGMALACRKRAVWCLISDGEIFEGSIYETANAMRKYKVSNLYVYLNWNGWSAYDKVGYDMIKIMKDIMPNLMVVKTSVEDYQLEGLSAHYVTL